MKIRRSLVISILLGLILLATVGYLIAARIEQPAEADPVDSAGAAPSSPSRIHAASEQPSATLSGVRQAYEPQAADSRSGWKFDRIVSRQASAASANGQTQPVHRTQWVATQTADGDQPVNSPGVNEGTSLASDSQQRSGSVVALTSQQGEQAAKPQPQEASVPMVLVDPTELNLNEGQQQQLASLQQDFVNAVGGENQNPADPAYFARWQSATEQSNLLFKLKFGIQAFLTQQMNSNHQAAE
jgi:hypothetical protein